MAAVAPETCTIPEDYINVLRNSSAQWNGMVAVAKYTLDKAESEQPMRRNGNETYITYLERLDPNKFKKANFNGSEKLNLVTLSNSKFDVSLIYKILPLLTNKIEKSGTVEWRQRMNDPLSFEKRWNDFKDMRNRLQHNIDDISSKDMLQKIEEVAFDILDLTETTFSVDPLEHDSFKSEMIDTFKALKTLKVKDAEVELIVNEGMCSNRAKNRIREDREKHVVVLPSREGIQINRKNIILPISIHPNKRTPDSGFEIPCQELLTIPTNFLVLKGSHGSGKTTLLRVILDKWAQTSCNKMTFSLLTEINIVVLIERKDVDKNTTLINVLKMQYSEVFGSVTSPESIMKALNELKLLVLIDGYGEKSLYSSELVKDVIECQRQCKSIKVIVADREAPALDLKTKLAAEGLGCELAIMKVSDKVDFLRNIENNLLADQLVETFNNFNSDIIDLFDTVKQLALFCALYKESPDNVKAWKSEGDVLRILREITEEDITTKIKLWSEEKIKGPDSVACTLVQNFGIFCLGLFHMNKHIISKMELQNFYMKNNVEQLEDVDEVNFNLLLSSIIFPKNKGVRDVDYHFHYSSIQEYLSAYVITKNLMDDPVNSSFEKVVQQITGHEITDIGRYANIIKHVILELDHQDCLEKYHQLLASVLRKINLKFPNCAEVFRASRNSLAVAKLMVRGSTKWNITRHRYLQLATMMLKTIGPNGVKRILVAQVTDASSDYYSDLCEFLKAVKGHTETEIGIELRYSHDEYKPVDEVVKAMANFRCKLYAFVGCVMEQESLLILNSCRKTASCGMLLSWPTSDHNWSTTLHHWAAALMSFTVQYTEADVPCKPLPLSKNGDAPLLSIKGCYAQTHQRLTQIIKDLAPRHIKEFKGVILRDCSLSEEVLSSVVNCLQSQGYRTDCTYDVSRPERLTKDDGSCVGGFFPSHTHEGNTTCRQLHLCDRSYPVLDESNSDETEDGATSFISALGQHKKMDRNFKNIIKYYEAEVNKVGAGVDATAFVLNFFEREDVELTFIRDVKEAAAEMKDDGEWVVDSIATARAAVLAAAHKKKPRVLKLVFTAQQPPMPLSAASETIAALQNCSDVRLYCWDTYYNNIEKGRELTRRRLALFKEHNTGCKLTTFYGQLDSAGLTEVPHTVYNLALAIKDQEDAATVRALQPWSGLKWLNVSVTSVMPAEELPPVPLSNVQGLYLNFPYMQDRNLDNIPKWIRSLVPDGHNNLWVYFHSCRLSSAAEKLPQLLTGIEITGIWFEGMRDVWEQKQRDSLTKKLQGALGDATRIEYF